MIMRVGFRQPDNNRSRDVADKRNIAGTTDGTREEGNDGSATTRNRPQRLGWIGFGYVAIALLVGGCGPYAIDPAPHPDALPTAYATTCAVDMTAPIRLAGANTSPRQGDLAYCAQSRWDDVLELYFQHPGVAEQWLRIDVQTRLAHVGEPVQLGSGAAALWDDVYSDYVGVVTLESDEPEWAVSVVAYSESEPKRAIVARWWGHSY
jgi:hypothetical protein